ncbi:MAG: signal recognition particle-docking protein FtsY [Alphaproteobacteria bacterium]|nr:signal recognition particle-docking protein FtsY [Alphaproteobacteria bacterium]
MSWFKRLQQGLQKSSGKLADGIGGIFTKRKLDAAILEELEELLIAADLGPAVAARLAAEFGKNRFGKEVSDREVREALAEQIAALLGPVAKPLEIDRGKKPFVVLVVGVNGVGKTTTIGKLAQHYAGAGMKVMMAAGDTFRAAAVQQLQIWGERTGAPVVAGKEGADAAGLVFTALERARDANTDLLLVDTAGRLHNKEHLMAELAKIVRVMKKLDESAPHATLLVLDATTGQNAVAQAETFDKLTPVTGMVVTKLDGTAKGGVLIALADRFKLPVHAIGVGEAAEDLKPFTAREFAASLLALDN